nr:MAG TPA: hypothetical protein [Caudoviricetes sp.]
MQVKVNTFKVFSFKKIKLGSSLILVCDYQTNLLKRL